MADYRQSNVTAGSKWTRSWQVNVENKIGKIPRIDFFEEVAVDTGDEIITKLVPGQISETFSDPSKTFNLINPLDGSVIGTASYQDLYIILSSLYLDLAVKRDIANTPV
jgi:hypothetical protein